MDNKKMLDGLKKERKLLAEHVPVIVARRAVKAMDETIRKMDQKKAEVD